MRGLTLGASGYVHWERALALEARIDEPPDAKLKQYRRAISAVTGAAVKDVGQFPQVAYWTYLASAPSIEQALNDFAGAL